MFGVVLTNSQDISAWKRREDGDARQWGCGLIGGCNIAGAAEDGSEQRRKRCTGGERERLNCRIGEVEMANEGSWVRRRLVPDVVEMFGVRGGHDRGIWPGRHRLQGDCDVVDLFMASAVLRKV